ncbi:MAG: response regulator [Armatimonadetes bacterium]|nr:response regulator [Armatimonadota bacterium]
MSRPRFFSLNLKLALTTIPLIVVFMSFNFFVLLNHEENILAHETEKRATSLARALAIMSAEAMRTFSNYLLQQNADQFNRLRDVEYVVVLDPEGRVLAHSDPRERGKTYTDDISRRAVQAAGDRLAEARYKDKQVLDVSSPILIESKRLGTVRIGLSLQGQQLALAQSRRHLFGLTLLLLAGATVFVGLMVRFFGRPLLHLARVSRELARGELEARAKIHSNDEVGLLGSALNHMASRLEHLIELEKEARERLQRRVHNLLEFTDRVISGDLTGSAPPGTDDEMGRLTIAVNEMVRHLRILLEEERSMREDLERSRAELESVNEKLKELDRMKSDFLNTVSHELRTPLTSIKAFAEILLDNAGEDMDTQMEFLQIINKESDRLTRLINNLLDLSRIEAGRMKWDLEPVDIQDVVASAAASLRGSAERKGLRFEAAVSEYLPTLGDQDKLIQVFTNLLGNAIKFTDEGGEVRISACRTPNGWIQVAVKDSGVGIAPENHESIFEKFSQVDISETRDIKGSGLGLPIARSIVEHHNGTIQVESELGAGSIFVVRLPLMEQQQRPAPKEIPAPAKVGDGSAGSNKVLVVDDEANIRRLLRHLLEGEGFEVIEAFSGEAAVELARKEKPRLVLLDLILPDVNGFEVLANLKKHPETRHTPVIILSIVEDEEKCYRLGANDYLPKPIDRERLLERVSALAASSERGRQEILVVDDDESVRRALRAMLAGHGYRVREASGGKQALAEIHKSPPDLVLLDLMMPDVTGHDVLRELKQNPAMASIPVVVLTAAEPDEQDRALRIGAESLMTKPFSEQELTAAVRELLSQVTAARGDSAQPSEKEAAPSGESP